jgi:regulator of replication initiation timing
MSDDYDYEAEDLLTTIEQVEETLGVMTTVVGHLKEQLVDQLEGAETVEMSAEEFLEQVDNPDGVWH